MHVAIIRSSGRMVRVERMGRLLLVYREPTTQDMRHPSMGAAVATCRYDSRFRLLPRSLA